ncbi:tRNA pseudouridine(55) synthase TruB [Humibacillus sp. DSM 29435]|uniref:tRNA pseudouridine(55) synthase TruB n=1 Tax=Humibacillus sp. DSM 29435 TaxID=1869167 RepID=UPI000872A97E|nr:tRNA pseudouridine(55) synthase TruB [Humibacillus sp. DSM 29435]OFE16600.1 tRNA pseudouridine(55) synthase TruB [Humibacillus sp. DSM 29435]
MSDASGLLVVDKPAGWTSHDVVARARRLCGTRRVGHAGTLDPMATGVLVLGVGRATKLLTFLVGLDKEYTATIRLGQATVTDDAEGEVTSACGAPDAAVTSAALTDAVSALTGDIQQVPSSVSAIKVNGERSYATVRKGGVVDLPARPVTVSRFDVLARRPAVAEMPDGAAVDVLDLDIVVAVSSGTYVRALARDLGERLGVGGHLTALRRTRVGRFDLATASPLDDLSGRVEQAGVGSLTLISLVDAARAQLEVHEISGAEAVRLGHGQRIASRPGCGDAVAAIDPAGRLVAVLDETATMARARVVFEPATAASTGASQAPHPASG